MTRDEGHAILNKMMEGQTFPDDQITEALIATGDIAGWREPELDGSLAAGMRSQGLDQAVQVAHQGTGSEIRGCLVAGHEGSHLESAWPGWSKYLDRGHEQGKK